MRFILIKLKNILVYRIDYNGSNRRFQTKRASGIRLSFGAETDLFIVIYMCTRCVSLCHYLHFDYPEHFEFGVQIQENP